MKSVIGLLLIVSALASGCLELLVTEKVPVLYVNVSVGEDANGELIIKEISARGDEISKLRDPAPEYPADFPAYYVSVVQDTRKVTIPSGKDYKGPGNYNFVLGFRPEFNQSKILFVSAKGVDKEGNYTVMETIVMNWSKEITSKTFKYD